MSAAQASREPAPITVGVIGAGARGTMFGRELAASAAARVVAVAEPRADYRQRFAATHDLDEEHCFTDWAPFCAGERLCDAVVIATLDRDHLAPALACLERGYHLLLEKPMATTLADCQAIAAAAERAGVVTSVCHSLRYGRPFAALKQVVADGRLGRVVAVDQLEQVSWWHQAHSFVRGRWGNEARSTFMLLAKSCHDLDYLAYLIAAPCRRVSSAGALTYFRPEHAPPDSGERCVACAVEAECDYSAIRHYVDADRTVWPANAVAFEHSREAHLAAITDGPYGQCVWKTDNDVVDHQSVLLEFAGDVTATFTMTGFTQNGGRRIRVHGTTAEAELDGTRIEVRHFGDGSVERIELAAEQGGHGGGDRRVVRSWLQAIAADRPELVVSNIAESLRTHRIVFAAEQARHEQRVVAIES